MRVKKPIEGADDIDRGSHPHLLTVPRLVDPETTKKKPGRPKKLAMPGMPEEVLSGMSPLERAHYEFFLAAFKSEFPRLTATDNIMLQMAALEYINLLRVQARQLGTGEVITMSRQHPGIQLRAWLDALSVTRKQRKGTKDDEADDKMGGLLAALSGSPR